MKKYISLALAVIMLVSVMAGCAESTKDIELGTVSADGVYYSEFAGITFTAPDGWTYATDEEKAVMMGIGSDTLSENNNKAIVEYAINSTVYDMMATSADGTEGVMVMFENTARYLGGKSLSEDGYLDVLAENLESMEDLNYRIGDRSDIKLGGDEYKCLSTSIPEYFMYQEYAVRRMGKYMICICFTSFSESGLSSYLGEYFS